MAVSGIIGVIVITVGASTYLLAQGVEVPEGFIALAAGGLGALSALVTTNVRVYNGDGGRKE